MYFKIVALLHLTVFVSPIVGQDITTIEIINHICEGDCIIIGEDLSTEYCYSWQEVDNTPWENAHNQSQTVCPASDEVYEVILTNDDGEIVQIVQFHTQVSSDLVQINPEVGFVCQLDGQTEILSIERPFATSAWSTGEVNTSSIEVSEAGDYSVTIIDEFGCEAIGTSEVVDLGINEDEIGDYLVANGFTCIPVRLVDFPTVNRPDLPIRSTTTTNSFEDLVIIDYGEGEVNLTSEVENFILSLNDHGLSSQAFLTINADFCSSVFADIEEEYNISGNENFLSLWYHLVDTPDSDNDCLYIKARYFADEDTNLSIPEWFSPLLIRQFYRQL